MESKAALRLVVIITLGILALEVAGALAFNSISLLADSFHVFGDFLAVAFSYIALRVAERPPKEHLTYGYHRLEVLSALTNGLTLFLMVGFIMYEAYLRLLNPQPVFAQAVLAVAVVGLVANMASARLLTSGEAHVWDLNIKSAFYHVLGDALASVAVIGGALAITFTGIFIFDPLMAVVVALIVLRGAVGVTWDGLSILMEKAHAIDISGLRKMITGVDGVKGIHDVHVWKICSTVTAATAHIEIDNISIKESEDVRKTIQDKLCRNFNVQHCTIQFETEVCTEPKNPDHP